MEPEVRLGAFTLRAPLARGGMSQVWTAEHASGAPAAVKVAAGGKRAEWSARSVRMEARAIGTLDHPNVVRVFDTGEVDAAVAIRAEGRLPAGQPWIAMELADAGDLSTRITEFDWLRTREMLLDLLDGLAHAHARGVLHRDLKPSNILFRHGADDEAARAVLSDFGIGWLRTDRRSIEGGTPSFMAPEQLTRRAHEEGPWTDLYALGCLTWAVVCGRVPYRGSDPAALQRLHCEAPIPALSPRFAVPVGLHGWVRTLMAKHPRDRFQRSVDAAWALTELGAPQAPGVDLTALDLETERWEVPTSQRTTLKLARRERGEPLRRTGQGVLEGAPFPEAWQVPARPPPQAAGPGLVGLREAPVVLRDAAQERLWASLERCTRGWTGVMGIQGPPEAHVDRLARWLVRRAHEVGLAVHRVRHAPVPGSFDGLRGLLAEHYGVARLDGQDLGEMLHQQLIDEGVDDPWEREAVLELLQPDTASPVLRSPVERYAVMLRVLQRTCGGRPLVLWLDRVEHGQDALDFAGFLVDHPERMRAVVVLTGAELPPRSVELVERSEGEVVSLHPLGHEGTLAALEGVLPLAPGVADRVLEVAGADPELGLEWLHLHRGRLQSSPEGLLVEGDDALPSVDEAWRARIEALEAPRRHALTIAALLGTDVLWSEWRGVCALLSASCDETTVEVLLAQRLVTTDPDREDQGFSLVHERLRASLEDANDAAADGPEVHRACAAMLAARGWSGALRRAHHLTRAGDHHAACEALVDAASGLLHSDRWGALQAIEAWRPLADSALESDDPQWGRGLSVLTQLLRTRERLEEHEEAADALVAWCRAHDEPRGLARGLEEQSRARRAEGGLHDAMELAQESVTWAERSGDLVQLGSSLAVLAESHRRQGNQEASEAAYRRAFDEGVGSSRLWGALSLAYLLAERGDLAPARQVLDELRRELGADTSPTERALLLHALAENLRMGGRPRAALPLFREARELERPAGRVNRTLEVNLALALLQARDDGEARERLEILSRRGDRLALPVKVVVASALLLLALREQRIDQAGVALESLEALPPTGGCRDSLNLLVEAVDELEATARPRMARRVLRVARAQAEVLKDGALVSELDQRLSDDPTGDTTSP